VASNGGATAWGALAKPLAPGETAPITATFVAATPWQGIPDASKTHWDGQKDTGTKFQSDTVKAVVLAADENGAELRVQAITAQATPMETPPWLGQRPPVEGDWVKSFAEEFDTATIDAAKWNIYGENFWDKASHFSKDNLLLGGGVAKLRYEKKRGCHNDDPKQTLALTNPKVSESAYATGFLDTYGKWTQRYGYFEARMKLPSAPGLWPAFWLMPDRGVAAGPQWKRADTGNGGMEFDIMEHLTRWGPYRYNIAMHWDGYGKAHKQTGSTGIYFQPDTEGFITAGLLWTPGLIVIYANGKEVARWESPRISNVQSHLMFTHVMGGWDNNALDDAKLPADFVIDYVRCWQRRDLASALDGPKPPAAIPAPTPAAE
jgi:beta-glucanase (GH16 family)